MNDNRASQGIGTAASRVMIMIASVLVGAIAFSPAMAERLSLALLERLSKGAWEIRFRDDAPPRRVCLRTGRELILLRHSGSECGRYFVDEDVGKVTVQYSCRGDGYGRTRIRFETPHLVQLESQGIANGRLFQFTAEARRIGDC